MLDIKIFDFNNESRELIKNDNYGEYWPTVYLLNDSEQIYIGESTNLYNRIKNHLDNDEKNYLKQITVIRDEQFNKSATLDLEQELIRLFDADKKYQLLNRNSGISANHNYYQREMYQNKMPIIWDELRLRNLAKNDYLALINSEFFKYSPYIKLNDEQLDVSIKVINDIINSLENELNITSIISGEAGTGKTVLALNIIFHLVNNKDNYIDVIDTNHNEFSNKDNWVINRLRNYQEKIGRRLKIGFVVPMTSLRKTLKKVLNSIPELKGEKLVIGPSDVVKKQYDVLIVDETHRLTARRGITNYNGFDSTSKSMGLNPKATTQLEWIVKNSKTRILFYDKNQMVKKADITEKELINNLTVTNFIEYTLTSQLRCLGGKDYLEYTRKNFK